MTAEHAYDVRLLPGMPGFAAHEARYLRADRLLPPGIDVLDLGCSVGYGAAILARGSRRVTGVDLDPNAVAQAAADHGSAAGFLVADAAALPFADQSFDAVACFEIVEHVDPPAALLSEVARVLRPGGILCLSTPNERMERLHARSRSRGANPQHVASLTPARLRTLLREAGFGDIVFSGQTVDRGRLHALLQAVDPLGLRLRLRPERRVTVARVFGGSAAGRGSDDFRFSRLLAYSAANTLAEARRR